MTPSQQRALFAAAAEAVTYLAEQLARNPSLDRALALHAQLSRALSYRIAPTTEKPCQQCRLVKPLTGFARRSHATDGRQTWCRRCVSSYQRNQAIADRAARETRTA